MLSIRPRNWSKFQHYKDRRPPWIKLHRELLDNYDWHCLPTASKALVPMLWLLASEDKGGIIMGDEVEIAFRLRISVSELEEALISLKEGKFFEDASVTLSARLQLAPESRSESETETEQIRGRRKHAASAPDGARMLAKEDDPWEQRLKDYAPGKFWPSFWGPRPESGRCRAPKEMLNGFAPPDVAKQSVRRM